MAEFEVRIPQERIGILIGKGGEVRRALEERTGVALDIDSATGLVKIRLVGDDPAGLLKARNVVVAVGRGFSPERAFRLLDEDVYFEVINLRDCVGKSESNLRRVKGRIIGEGGRTRRLIEETTGAYVSVYGHTISIIGDLEGYLTARQAIEMLIRGGQHRTVYRFLFTRRRQLRQARLKERTFLWKA